MSLPLPLALSLWQRLPPYSCFSCPTARCGNKCNSLKVSSLNIASWQIQNFHWISDIKIHPNFYSMGLELHGSPPPPPQASRPQCRLSQLVGQKKWPSPFIVRSGFSRRRWHCGKGGQKRAKWGRRAADNPDIWHWRAYKHTRQTRDQRHWHHSNKFYW